MAVGQPILDVSFAGARVRFSGAISAEVTDFMDDANPIEVQEVEVSGAGANLNGNMIRYAKPNLVMLSVTVIPLSPSDMALREGIKKFRVQGGQNRHREWEQAVTCTIAVQDKAFVFTNGTPISGHLAPSSTAEGKMQGRTYTFAFVSVSG